MGLDGLISVVGTFDFVVSAAIQVYKYSISLLKEIRQKKTHFSVATFAAFPYWLL
jgi:hypothetical protein